MLQSAMTLLCMAATTSYHFDLCNPESGRFQMLVKDHMLISMSPIQSLVCPAASVSASPSDGFQTPLSAWNLLPKKWLSVPACAVTPAAVAPRQSCLDCCYVSCQWRFQIALCGYRLLSHDSCLCLSDCILNDLRACCAMLSL